MKISNAFILGGILLGGAYLISKYVKPGNIVKNTTATILDTAKTVTLKYVDTGFKDNLKETQVFRFNENINAQLPRAKQTQDFLNITSFITRNNPFTRTVSPVIDWTLKTTSETINKYLGG